MSSAVLIPAGSLPSLQDAAPFKRLKMRHRRVVALHLSGVTAADIDRLMGAGAGFASGVLNNPTTKQLLERCYSDFDMELRALVPGAIRTLSRNMGCGDPPTEVRAAREVLLANGKYENVIDKGPSAEDVIERVLEVVDPDGTRYTMAERRLSRIAGSFNPAPIGLSGTSD